MKDLKYIAAIKTASEGFNDIEITADGDLAAVEGAARIKQDVVKILLTELGLMPYPNYGSSLPSLVGSDPFSTSLLDTVSSEVISNIHYLIFSEESQLLTEQIAEIKTLDVSFANGTVMVNMVLISRAAEEIALGFSL
jgi:hypothetical protein